MVYTARPYKVGTYIIEMIAKLDQFGENWYPWSDCHNPLNRFSRKVGWNLQSGADSDVVDNVLK